MSLVQIQRRPKKKKRKKIFDAVKYYCIILCATPYEPFCINVIMPSDAVIVTKGLIIGFHSKCYPMCVCVFFFIYSLYVSGSFVIYARLILR